MEREIDRFVEDANGGRSDVFSDGAIGISWEGDRVYIGWAIMRCTGRAIEG